MAFARFFSLLHSKKTVEQLTPEEFRDKYFQMTAEDIKKFTQDNRPSCILDEGEGKFKLYLGNIRHATDFPVIQELGIMYILNTAYSERDVNTEIYGPQRKFLGVSMDDDCTYDISKDFIQCIEFIKTAKKEQKAILIHCMAGVSRSATVTIAYIMQQHKMSLKDAATLVSKRRPIIFPNIGFIRHLMEYEKKL